MTLTINADGTWTVDPVLQLRVSDRQDVERAVSILVSAQVSQSEQAAAVAQEASV